MLLLGDTGGLVPPGMRNNLPPSQAGSRVGQEPVEDTGGRDSYFIYHLNVHFSFVVGVSVLQSQALRLAMEG